MQTRHLLSLLISVAIPVQAGFAPGIVDHRAAPNERSLGNQIKSESACTKQNGRWIQENGVASYCVLPYADAGKRCISSKDCLGHCIAVVPEYPTEALPDYGTCQVNDSKDDCGRPHYENGKVTYFNCD